MAAPMVDDWAPVGAAAQAMPAAAPALPPEITFDAGDGNGPQTVRVLRRTTNDAGYLYDAGNGKTGVVGDALVMQAPAVAPAAPAAPVEDWAPVAAPQMPQPPQPKGNVFDEPGPSYGSGLTDAVQQGATFGLADEVGAAGRAFGAATDYGVRATADFLARQLGLSEPFKGQRPDIGKVYDQALAEKRDAAKDFADEYPTSNFLANLVGGMASTPANAVVSGAKSGLDLAINGGRVGAAMGAAQGFGNAEGGAGERLTGAAEGGVLGGVLGASAPTVVPFLSRAIGYPFRLIGRAYEPFTKAGQEKIAGRVLSEAAGTPKPVIEAPPVPGMKPSLGQATNNPGLLWLERSAEQGSPAGRVVAENTRAANNKALTEAIGSLGDTEAGAAPRAGAEMRAAVQRATPPGTTGERAAADLADTLGTTGETHDLAAILGRRQREVASPLFKEAFSVGPVHSDRLAQFTKDPDVQRGIRNGVRTEQLEALAEGRPFNPAEYGIVGFNDAGEPILGAVPTMRQLAAGKRGLDDILEGYRDKVTGKLVLDERGRAIDAVRRAYLKELRTLNPKYGEALDAWSGPAQSKDALYAGRNVFRPDAEITAKRIAEMSDGDKQFFREGATRAVQDLIDGTPDGADALARLLGKPAMREKLQAAFPSPEAYQAWEQRALAMVEPPPVAKVQARDLAGNAKIPDSGVADEFIKAGKGGPEALNSYLRKIGNDPAGLQAARDAFARKFLDEVSSVAPDASGARFVLAGKTTNFIKAYEHVIDSRLFTNDQRALIRAIGKGADMATRTARGGAQGGSDTYSKLAGGRFVDAMIGTVPARMLTAGAGAASGFVAGGPGGAVIGAGAGGLGGQKLVDALYAAPREKIVALIEQSLHDPDLAKALMMKATPKAVDMMPKRVQSALVGVLGAGAVAGASRDR